MKDIENYKLPRVDEALQRMERALARLETAAAGAAPVAPLAKQVEDAERKLSQLSRSHDALKDAATRVASRLDTAIGRLSDSLDHSQSEE